MYELIISEKPQAALKIAQALSDTKLEKVRESNVNYFSLTHNKKQIRVASAVGHLFILGEKGGESWKYPVFETEWKPLYKVNKSLNYTKDYIKVLKNLGKNASQVTIASDFDIEGEVIGLNVIREILGREDANRMKFSTLTKDELIRSYNNKMPHIEWGQAFAGETRHHLDWFYGINISRALTQSIKAGTNKFKVLSSGRVQGPSLHFLAQREKKILDFKPVDFAEIYLNGNSKNVDFQAKYEEDKIFDLEKAKKILDETKDKDGVILDILRKEFKQKVPTPFDLTSLQIESSNMFGISPKRTLEIAQKLYIQGFTSYPRTSSQKLPKELDLKKILEKLSKQPLFRDKVGLIFQINPSLKPNEGKKTDPAHPAIHPTGEVPSKLDSYEQKVYDLICKRFFAIFGKEALRETNTVKIDINSYIFVIKGTRTIKKNWHELYEPYLRFEEVVLPALDKNQSVKNCGVEKLDKKTNPPKRYTDSSIIKELEKRNLGTKATRAEILNNLRERGYIIDKSIKVTELGLLMDDVLSKEVPDIVDETLTRHFEEEMEMIREKKSTPKNVLDKAKKELLRILEDIKLKEKELGVKLAGANFEAEKKLNTVGICPKCKEGTLMIRKSKKNSSKFIACDKYPDCKTIFNIPQFAVVRGGENLVCPECSYPQIIAGKTDFSMKKFCINPSCPTRVQKDEDGNVIEDKKFAEENMLCPICKTGKMVLRKSFYGVFLGCDNYPKCKTMMKIVNGKVDINPIDMNKSKSKKKFSTKTTKKVVKKAKTKSKSKS